MGLSRGSCWTLVGMCFAVVLGMSGCSRFFNDGRGGGVSVLDTISVAPKVVVGYAHVCALSSRGVVKCWGDNWGGQLGIGDNLTRGDDPGEMGANLPAVDFGNGRYAVDIVAG